MNLFPKNQKAYRSSTGAYDAAGIWQEGQKSEISFIGSIQPSTSKDIKSLPENRQDVGSVKIYTSDRLQVSYQGGNTAGDLILFDNKLWEIISEENHANGLLEHFKYMAYYIGPALEVAPLKLSQTITFNSVLNKLQFGPDFNLAAFSSSGLPISFINNSPELISVENGIVKILGFGTVSITAIQNGNSFYEPATPVTITFNILEQDQFWDKVVLMMHMDGANNSVDFIDEKGHAITRYDGSHLNATEPRFGTAALETNGSNAAVGLNSVDFALTQMSKYTIECEIKPHAIRKQVIQSTIEATSTKGWALELTTNNEILFKYGSGPSVQTLAQIPTNQYSHIAISKNELNVKVFINGSLAAESNAFVNAPILESGNLFVGFDYAHNFGFNGLSDEFRITANQNRYFSSFTRPAKAFLNQ